MSLLQRIEEANTGTLDGLLPLVVDGRRVGQIRPQLADRLRAAGDVFVDGGEGLALHPVLASASLQARSEAVAGVLGALRSEGLFQGWRDELFALTDQFAAPPALLVERATLPLFGARGYGVHVNGFVRDGADLRMWVARRARDKPTWPGCLDQIVAGGQAAGLGLLENVVKECGEEAGIEPRLAAQARPVGTVSYCMDTPLGVRPDTLFVFDLELPADFEPRNVDGEVEAFELLPVEAVRDIVAAGPAFKTNCSLVVIDFLLRHGLLAADDADYEALARGVRR